MKGWRIAGLVLVALVACFSLPLGALDAPSAAFPPLRGSGHHPRTRVESRRGQVEVRASVHRLAERFRAQLAAFGWSLVLALVFLGLVAEAAVPRRLGRPLGAAAARAPPFVR